MCGYTCGWAAKTDPSPLPFMGPYPPPFPPFTLGNRYTAFFCTDDSKTVMFSLSHKNEGKLCCLVSRFPRTGNITVDTPATLSSSTRTS